MFDAVAFLDDFTKNANDLFSLRVTCLVKQDCAVEQRERTAAFLEKWAATVLYLPLPDFLGEELVSVEIRDADG